MTTIAVRHSARRRRRGRVRFAALETAVALAAFAAVILLLVQATVAFNHYRSVSDAVRAGVQTAAVSRTARDPVGATIAEVRTTAAELDQARLEVGVTSDWVQGDPVEVVVRYPYEITLFGFTLKSGYLESREAERVQ